ncbi:MAG: hypothetical protein F6K30_05030 [Cyanothece sp. SIO2G6]|nr:hypothetical protein [Cyanothece sp. SIO2G6]
MTQTIQLEHLSPEAANRLLEAVPAYVKEAFHRRAAEIEYPIEAVVEMALANFLDDESLSFEDCLLSGRLDTAD